MSDLVDAAGSEKSEGPVLQSSQCEGTGGALHTATDLYIKGFLVGEESAVRESRSGQGTSGRNGTARRHF